MVRRALGERKYALLLGLLLITLAFQSFATRPGSGTVLADGLRTLLSVAILLVVFERPRERAVMALVLAGALAIAWGRDLSAGNDDHTATVGLYGLMVLFLSGAVYVILRQLFRAPAGSADQVLGAICGYLIAGDAWAAVNAVTYHLLPASYSINPEVAALLADWHGRMALFSYYSIAQMLTVGYADVTPIRAPATTIGLFSTLFGVFYTAIVVSQFVGLAQARKGAEPDRE
jgi:hypothetical protein